MMNLQSTEARDFIKLTQDFHTLFKNDFELASRIYEPSARESASTLATSVSGAAKVKAVNGIMGLLMRNISFPSFLSGINKTFSNEEVGKRALYFHIKRALEKSEGVNDFNRNLITSTSKSKFSNDTLKARDELINAINKTSDEVQEGVKNEVREIQLKEQLGLSEVVYNGANKALVYKDLQNLDEALLLEAGNKNKGGIHIRLKHSTNEEQKGFVSKDEVMNLGKNIRAFLKENEPFMDSNGARLYEWSNENGVKFRVVVNDRAGVQTHALLSPAEEIITFYSNRNLKEGEKFEFKNPKLREKERGEALEEIANRPEPVKSSTLTPNLTQTSLKNDEVQEGVRNEVKNLEKEQIRKDYAKGDLKTYETLQKYNVNDLNLLSKAQFENFVDDVLSEDIQKLKNAPNIVHIANLNEDLKQVLGLENAKIFLRKNDLHHFREQRKAGYNQNLDDDTLKNMPEILSEAKEVYKDSLHNNFFIAKELNEKEVATFHINKDELGNYIITAKRANKDILNQKEFTRLGSGIEPHIYPRKNEDQLPATASPNLEKDIIPQNEALEQEIKQDLEPNLQGIKEKVFNEEHFTYNRTSEENKAYLEKLELFEPSFKEQEGIILQIARNTELHLNKLDTMLQYAKEKKGVELEKSRLESLKNESVKEANAMLKLSQNLQDFMKLEDTQKAYEANNAIKEQLAELENKRVQSLVDLQDELNKANEPNLAKEKEYFTDENKGIASLRKDLKAALSPLLNKEITNKETGLKGFIGSDEITKISSKKAVDKSVDNGFTREEHFKVSEDLKNLFESATLKEKHEDYKGRKKHKCGVSLRKCFKGK